MGVDEESHRQDVAVLLQYYPNPAFGSTTVAFELGEPAHVELAVFDVLGRNVRSLVGGYSSTIAAAAVAAVSTSRTRAK